MLLRPDGSVEVFVGASPRPERGGSLSPAATGACPRSAADVDRLVDEAGVEAILCLQSEDCWKAMGIDGAAVEQRAGQRGVLWLRVAVRDFDRLDQAAMLPDIVRALSALTAAGRRTYVHCTAGINRAPLSVVGLLTFVRGWEVEAAVAHVKGERGQANPYVEPWRLARQRLLAGRAVELYLLSLAVGAGCSREEGGDGVARDWGRAQRQLLRTTFARRAEVDVNLLRSSRLAAPPAASAAAAPSSVPPLV